MAKIRQTANIFSHTIRPRQGTTPTPLPFRQAPNSASIPTITIGQGHTIATTVMHACIGLAAALFSATIVFYIFKPNMTIPMPTQSHVIRYMKGKYGGGSTGLGNRGLVVDDGVGVGYEASWFKQMMTAEELEKLANGEEKIDAV